jgi:phosphatidylserine decarboxylase
VINKPLSYYFFVLLPKNILSRWAGWLATKRLPTPFLMFLLKNFVKVFKVNMNESQYPLESFPTFNDFFTRPLKPGLRPIAGDADIVVSPVDGIIGPFGNIKDGRLIQAKGLDYSLAQLLDDPEKSRFFQNGQFITIYLAPYHYHRIHAMVGGKISKGAYIPGALWTVSPIGVNYVKNLFAINERLNTYIDTPKGPCVLIKVGATVVGKIKVKYSSVESNLANAQRQEIRLENPYKVEKGDEVGRFELGSTVICIFPPQSIQWENIRSGQDIFLGQPLAKFINN